jgi:NTE family protein
MRNPLSEDLMDRIEEPGASADAGEGRPESGQKVLVLQGGGALGAYQGGVFEALMDGGVTPDWVIGTSIGAINAAIIAGNHPQHRLARLQAFWRRVEHSGRLDAGLGAERAGFYSTAPLERTLSELIDFDVLNNGSMRLTVGTANLRTAEMRYFDSRAETLTVRHIMASCALPPAFPPVRIDGELYWDGGVVSNTPLEAVFDDNPRRSGLVFAVHMWNADGPEPDTMAKVFTREKDVRYSSRAVYQVARQKQLHKLRHVISELASRLPEEVRSLAEVKALAAYGCTTRMHVVRLTSPMLEGETSTKDIDFDGRRIAARWRQGRHDAAAVLVQAPWRGEFDPLEGFIVHDAGGEATAPDAS